MRLNKLVIIFLLFLLFAPISIFAAEESAQGTAAPTAQGGKDDTAQGGKAPTAQGDLFTPAAKKDLMNPLTGAAGASPVDFINNLIKSLMGLSGVLALVAFIWGGITWMISMGDPGKVQKGQKMMIWAVIGIVLIFSSYAVLYTVLKAFGFGSGS